MPYKYTLLKQDGTKEDLGTRERNMELKEMYKILGCSLVELIPGDYYPEEFAKADIYGDEEGRFDSTNKRNPFMKVLYETPQDEFLNRGWDCVGDLLAETNTGEPQHEENPAE